MTTQSTDRRPAVAEPGNMPARRSDPLVRPNPAATFFVFLASALPNLRAHRGVSNPTCCLINNVRPTHAGPDARLPAPPRSGSASTTTSTSSPVLMSTAPPGTMAALHNRHGGRLHGPRAAGGPRAELEVRGTDLRPVRGIRSGRAQWPRRRAGLAVHLRTLATGCCLRARSAASCSRASRE